MRRRPLRKKGGEIQTNTEVTDIYQDETGTVVGVAAGKKNYKANKGVVFAMASIDHNEEMAFRYDQQQYWDLKTQFVATAETNTGDGIRIGMAHGADSAFHGAVDLILQTWSYTTTRTPRFRISSSISVATASFAKIPRMRSIAVQCSMRPWLRVALMAAPICLWIPR